MRRIYFLECNRGWRSGIITNTGPCGFNLQALQEGLITLNKRPFTNSQDKTQSAVTAWCLRSGFALLVLLLVFSLSTTVAPHWQQTRDHQSVPNRPERVSQSGSLKTKRCRESTRVCSDLCFLLLLQFRVQNKKTSKERKYDCCVS